MSSASSDAEQAADKDHKTDDHQDRAAENGRLAGEAGTEFFADENARKADGKGHGSNEGACTICSTRW